MQQEKHPLTNYSTKPGGRFVGDDQTEILGLGLLIFSILLIGTSITKTEIKLFVIGKVSEQEKIQFSS